MTSSDQEDREGRQPEAPEETTAEPTRRTHPLVIALRVLATIVIVLATIYMVHRAGIAGPGRGVPGTGIRRMPGPSGGSRRPRSPEPVSGKAVTFPTAVEVDKIQNQLTRMLSAMGGKPAGRGKIPEDLPIPPGSRLIWIVETTGRTGGRQTTQIILQANTSMEKAAGFFKRHHLSAGWTLRTLPRIRKTKPGTRLVLALGSRYRIIFITPGADESKAMVLIHEGR